MTMAEKLLKLLLYGAGVTCGLGAVALFMPRHWMVLGCEFLGMEAFPSQPVAEYLARETSGMYAFYGVLLIGPGDLADRHDDALFRRHADVLALERLWLGRGHVRRRAGSPGRRRGAGSAQGRRPAGAVAGAASCRHTN